MVKDGKTVVGVGSLTGRLMNLSGPEIIEWGKLAEDILETVLKPKIQAATMDLGAAVKKLSIEDITRAFLGSPSIPSTIQTEGETRTHQSQNLTHWCVFWGQESPTYRARAKSISRAEKRP